MVGSNDNDSYEDVVVDELLRRYYRDFLEDDGVPPHLIELVLSSIPSGRRQGPES